MPYDSKCNIKEPEQEQTDNKKQTRVARYIQEKALATMDADTRRRGFCPYCYILLPITGICHCGYKKVNNK